MKFAAPAVFPVTSNKHKRASVIPTATIFRAVAYTVNFKKGIRKQSHEIAFFGVKT